MNTSGSLQHLHDIVVPAPPAWFPPAPGWYALGFSLSLLLVYFLLRRYRHYRQNHYRRQALRELDELKQQWQQNRPAAQWLPRLPVLLKRAALAAYGRQQVAALSGTQWLRFLDRTAGKTLFNNNYGQLLLQCGYAPPVSLRLQTDRIQTLFSLTRIWLTNHRLPAGDSQVA